MQSECVRECAYLPCCDVELLNPCRELLEFAMSNDAIAHSIAERYGVRILLCTIVLYKSCCLCVQRV